MRPYSSVVVAFVLFACATSNPKPLAAEGSAELADATTPPHSSEPASSSKVAAATSVAQSWLDLVDRGKYGESWDAAAPIFRDAVSRDHWAAQVGSGRAPLGKLVSRKLLSAQYTTTLPGLGEGEYVVIRYAAAYENKPNALETITPMMTSNGTWHVAGYYMK